MEETIRISAFNQILSAIFVLMKTNMPNSIVVTIKLTLTIPLKSMVTIAMEATSMGMQDVGRSLARKVICE